MHAKAVLLICRCSRAIACAARLTKSTGARPTASAAVVLILISVLSAIGICERCRVQSGGVYFLIAHVLGSRRGAAVGIIYVLGQVRKGERTPQSLQILHLQLSSLNS